ACFALGTPGGSAAFAQTTNGRLIVTVKDQTGDTVTGATISVVNQETQQEVTGTTSDGGVYTQSQLQVGLYTVTVTAGNFKTNVQQDVKIDVGQDHDLVVSLEPGLAGESVTVT